METLEIADADGWEIWLAEHHENRSDAWLRVRKQHAEIALPTIAETGELALCFGWIDGQRKALDELSFLQRYSRRRPRSSWSKVNVGRVESLIAGGRMRPPGLAEVEQAQADGRWGAAYESQRNASVPAELRAVLLGNSRARMKFESLGRSEQYTLMLPMLKTYTPKSRADALRRIILRLER